jgi:signal transduction histidine kinase
VLSLLPVVIAGASQAAPSPPITKVSEILTLAPGQADRKIPVSITGVVTVAEPTWKGMFFVQDSTGGVFVNNTNGPGPVPGDLVEVTGVSDRGGYSPDVVSPQWKKLGNARLPEARPVSIERLMSGAEDGQRVEVSAVVRTAQAGQKRLAVELESGAYRFQAFLPLSAVEDVNAIVGAKVRLRGTSSVSQKTQQGLRIVMFVPQEADLGVVQGPPELVITNRLLTKVTEILALTTEQATRRISVSVTGVVTAAEPDWGRNFFVQDQTGGVFVNSLKGEQPVPGDVVHVTGVSHAGGYAPDILEARWEKLGAAPLPEAKAVSVGWLMSGAEDGRRVEVSGVVRTARPSEKAPSQLAVQLASGAHRFWAFAPLSTLRDPSSLVGATVRVRGTAAAAFNQTLRHILTVVMFAPQESDFIVEQIPGNMIEQEPFTPCSGIAQYRPSHSPEPRIRVKGVVTYQRPGVDIFLRDETGGLQVKSGDTNLFVRGEIVEAIGFAGLEGSLPVLEDAILVRTTKSEKRIVPDKVSISELLAGFHHSDFVSLQGKLLDCSLRPLRAVQSLSNAPEENILTLQNGTYFFSLKAPATPQFAELISIPPGSTLEVSGVCILQAGEGGKMESAQILLPNAGSVKVVKRPGWWTAQRLLSVLGILAVASFVGTTWTLMIMRRNSALKASIAEKVSAQAELQKAHDELESRIEERTRELQFETGARREAEVRFDATVAERRRIAQELHDTLLQGFTGIGLKLDALNKSLPPSLGPTRQELEKLLEQSDEYLVEARRAVWELRSPSVEKVQDFSKALMKVSERALEGTPIPLHFSTSGTVCKPPPAVEDNLLRICEEAVRNAAKHARPTEVQVSLECTSSELRLRVRDDGCGFNPHGPEGAKDGHFGLLGIRERVKALSGNLSLSSHEGEGTEILVAVRLAQA